MAFWRDILKGFAHAFDPFPGCWDGVVAGRQARIMSDQEAFAADRAALYADRMAVEKIVCDAMEKHGGLSNHHR
jgi:hypothetical protein